MSFLDPLAIYVLAYPSSMALLWVVAGLYYFVTLEKIGHIQISDASCSTFVSIMVPCFNEAANVDETIGHLLKTRYDNFEILLINDGSSDNTAELIDAWAVKNKKIRALHQINQGKATALNHGLNYAKGEVLICIDGDAVLDYDAVSYMVKALNRADKIGVVTGNPRVRNRSTIIGELQVTEFSSIVGLLKRAQSLYGTIFTISGVVGCFRKTALQEVGGWSTDMITEDIDISWKLQMAGYDIAFEPNALCWVLMPETIRGLFKQRLRWAQGGAEVFLKYSKHAAKYKNRRFWPLLLEYVATAVWAYSLIALFAVGLVTDLNVFEFELLRSSGFITLFICMLQFSTSLFIDSHYERNLWRSFVWCIWYPLVYWLLNVTTMVIALPKAIFRKKGQLAVWVSPDRGVK